MGTRADFYVEADDGLHWIASIGWDGYPDAIRIKHIDEEESEDKHIEVTYTDYITDCRTLEEYQLFLNVFLSGREDVTYPTMGWPWPWENSHSTDYAYVFSNQRKEVLIACFGRGWYNLAEFDKINELPEDEWNALPKVTNFPDMTNKMNVAWDARSGLVIFRTKE